MKLIYDKLNKILEHEGVQLMEVDKGVPFDSDFHEAISQLPTEEDELKGKVIEVVEKGYLLNDQVIRFSKVIIGA